MIGPYSPRDLLGLVEVRVIHERPARGGVKRTVIESRGGNGWQKDPCRAAPIPARHRDSSRARSRASAPPRGPATDSRSSSRRGCRAASTSVGPGHRHRVRVGIVWRAAHHERASRVLAVHVRLLANLRRIAPRRRRGGVACGPFGATLMPSTRPNIWCGRSDM